MNGTDVVIVGGGVAGAAAACAFAIAGSRLVLFERRDLVRDPNRGDNLHPPTRALLAGGRGAGKPAATPRLFSPAPGRSARP